MSVREAFGVLGGVAGAGLLGALTTPFRFGIGVIETLSEMESGKGVGEALATATESFVNDTKDMCETGFKMGEGLGKKLGPETAIATTGAALAIYAASLSDQKGLSRVIETARGVKDSVQLAQLAGSVIR